MYGLVFCVFYSASETFLLGIGFWNAFGRQFCIFLLGLTLWTAMLLPMYLLSKRNPKLADKLMTAFVVILPIAFITIIIYVLTLAYSH